MASASICRINICRITFIVKKKYDHCKALQYQFEPVYIFRDKCDVIFGTFVA